jgi:ribosomal-protein-alanine N-acetyltransferase
LNFSTGAGQPVFRAAKLEDLADIAELDGEEFGDLCVPHRMLRPLFDLHGSDWVVADIGGKVCGYALVCVSAQRRGWLMGLAVAKQYRGCGFGRELLERAVTSCRTALADSIYLTVKPTEQSVVKLYEDTGFRRVSREQQYFGEGEPRDVLVYPIQRPPVTALFPGRTTSGD